MRVIVSILSAAVMLGAPGESAAQAKKAEPKKGSVRPKAGPEGCTMDGKKVECWTYRFGDDSTFRRLSRFNMDSVLMKRPALGLELSGTGSPRDTIGVFISRVTPKGPAENAGIVEGDRIVAINGVDLKVNAADAGDSYASGLPTRRLQREVAKLTPGTAVTLRVWSGGRIRDVRVTTARAYDLRDRGSFGSLFDGDGVGHLRGQMPNFENMRMPLMELREKMPLLRLEDGERRRLLERLRVPRMHMESLPRIRDGGQVRVISPSHTYSL